LSGATLIQNSLKQGALSPLLFSFALEFSFMKLQENWDWLMMKIQVTVFWVMIFCSDLVGYQHHIAGQNYTIR
jgi:hypothetical protein